MEILGPNGRRWAKVEAAVTFRARLRGLIGRRATLLLLETKTVHSFWLTAPIRLVGIDPSGVVMSVRILKPRRVVWLGGVRLILEMPPELFHPEVGDRLTFRADDGEADAHARPSVSVRHTHRQSR